MDTVAAKLSTAIEYAKKLEETSSVFSDQGWDITEQYPFTYYSNKQFQSVGQGWKIHISCLSNEAIGLLNLLTPILLKEKASFKIVNTYAGILSFNGGSAGLTQLGKIITIYPHSTDDAYTLGQRLDEIWHSSNAPVPPSDLCFRPGGNVSLRFGVINNKQTIIHHDNRTYPALIDPSGNLVPDISSKNGEQISWAPMLPGTLYTNNYLGKELDFLKELTGDRYVVVYPLIKKIFTSNVLCMDMETMKPVSIKIHCKRSDVNQDGVSFLDCAKNEVTIASVLSSVRLAPDVLATFEDAYFHYAVYEYIIGDIYAVLPKDLRLKMLPLLLQKVQTMHDLGIVHRDLKLANILVKNDELYFIDFELAATTGTLMPLEAGTPGYVPPESIYAVVEPSYDCYSLAGCLIHAYVGIDPAFLPSDIERRLNAVASYIPAKTLELIRALYSSNPSDRPAAIDCIKHIEYPQNLTVSISESNKKLMPDKVDKLINEYLLFLDQNAVEKDNTVYWISSHKNDLKHFKWGLNTGVAGVVLGLLCILNDPERKKMYRSLAEKAASYIYLNDDFDNAPPGLFTGLAGSALALGAAFQASGNKKYLDKSYELLFKAIGYERCNYDFFSGYSGMTYVAIKIFQSCNEERFLKIADYCMERLMAESEIVDGITAWKVNILEEQPRYEIGAAHGSAGIALSIALYGVATKSETHIDFAIKCFREIFLHARSEERKCYVMDIGVKFRHPASNNIWCHGAAGYLWAAMQVPQMHERLRDEIEWTISICAEKSHLSNPTYCHGMAGSLELWRLVNGSIFGNELTNRVFENTLYELINISQLHDKFELFSCEDIKAFSPDLWIGFTGPVSALVLTKIKSAESILNIKW